MFDGYSGGMTNVAIRIGKVGPRGIQSSRVDFPMKGFQSVTQFLSGVDHPRFYGFICRLRPHIGDSIESRLNLSTSDGEVHRSVDRIDDRISDWQRSTCEEFLLGSFVGSSIVFEMDGVQLSPAPIQSEQSILVSGGEFRTVTKSHSSRRSRANIYGRG